MILKECSAMKFSHLYQYMLVTIFCASSALGDSRPNIVLIISDDMGYSDLGCYGGEIETPALDSIAADGLRFTNYYVNNMCWPTRASLMTSLYPKTALPYKGSAAGGLHPHAVTLPQTLAAAGYCTFMSGKWHLSNSGKPDGPNAPHHRGFDQFYGTIHGASDFFAPADLQLNGKSMRHQWNGKEDYYYTDAITDQALGFLEQRDQEKPFFLYVAYTSAHWPLHAKPEDIAHYQGRYELGWDALRRQRHARMKELGVVDPRWELSPRHPLVPAWEDAEENLWQQRRMEVYAAQVTCMDRNIGRITDYLRDAGITDNTMVVYQHDNGGCHVEYGEMRKGSWSRDFTTDGKKTPIKPGNVPGLMPGSQATFQSYGYGWANASNTPFRLFKQYDHEGGTHSPLIISWPDGMAKKRTGKLAGEICHVIDMMPTLLDIAGVNFSEQQPVPFEGRSFAPVLQGKRIPEHAEIFWGHAHGKAVLQGDWKLVAAEREPWELYDLSEDGTELHDLASEMPEKLNELKKLHAAWTKRTTLNLETK
tara:strand:+ start:3710 stop:5314 length:1605 start_codon:yes stop_codon:yes gene_type:complete